jgi:hypothetical protein
MEGPQLLPFAFFPSLFSITVSGSLMTEVAWLEALVDLRPILIVHLGWVVGGTPLSARPVGVGVGVGGDDIGSDGYLGGLWGCL